MDVESIAPLEHVAYLYDGTPEGLMCAIFDSFKRGETPEDITTEQRYQPRFLQSQHRVVTSFEIASRVRAGIVREGGDHVFNAILRSAATEEPDAEVSILRFVRYLMDNASGRNKRINVLDDLSNPVVERIAQLNRRALNEAEKTRQFVRFNRLENGVFFARCNPNVSVLPFVMDHFAERFNIQPFIIYDENHAIAGVYDGTSWSLIRDTVPEVSLDECDDSFYEALWAAFFHATTIDSRFNPELQRHFMPVRLRKHLPELKPDPSFPNTPASRLKSSSCNMKAK